MAENPWVDWVKSNILEIIILILVLVLVIKAFSPTQEVSKIQAGKGEVSKEVLPAEQVQPPKEAPTESVATEQKVEEKPLT